MPQTANPARAARWQGDHRVTRADLNGWGVMHGGRLMTLADEAGFRAAFAHARLPALTRAAHDIGFHRQAREGELLRIEAQLADTGRTSLWTLVEIFDATSGALVMDGVFVFVALSGGRPARVPPVATESPRELAARQRIRRLREQLAVRF